MVVPSAVGGWGDKTFRIARYGELYFSENLGGLASGSYTLMAEDSVGCTISQEVEIKETPVGIDSLTLQGVDDCVPGNTKLIVETTGDHLPLVYRLNGRLLSGPVVDLPRVAGNYTLEVEDTMGCADHQVQYFPAYDSLVVASSNVTDCTLIDGTIQFSYEGVDISKLSFSIDGGENWQDQNGTFMALSKGSYIPMVRNNASSCVQTADTININAPDCFPIVGFLKDTLTINDARELVVLPWQIDRNGYSDTLNYTLRLGREGDGVPHFNDERLRSTTSPIHFREYPAEHPGGKDSLVLTLQDSAYLYRIPEAYTFHLETPAGSPLKIDPLHGRMTVFVNFTDSVIIERKEVTLCPGTEQLTLGEDLGDGYCYAWEGPVSSHFPVISITPTQSGEYRLNIIRNTDFKLYKTIIYSVKVESKQVTITSSGNVLCEGGAKLLGLLFSDGGAIDPLSWEIKWEDGSSAVPRVVRPSSSSIYGVKIKNRLSACVIEDTLRIQVLQKPSHVTILPVEAFICSTSSSPGLDLEVEFPRTDSLTYFWSNGTRDYKTKVFQPGSYYVDVAYKNMASCATRFYTQVKNGFKVAIEADTSGICPDSIPLTARIINPVQGTTYAYSWSNGETTQTIVSQGMNYTYAVTVSNNQQGCVGSDSLDVEPILNRMEQRKAQKIQAELLALGFINFPCKILPLGLSPSPQLRSNEVVDYAGGMVIELGGQRINLAQRLAGVVSSMQVDSLAATGYITRNENFCEAAKRFKLALASYNQDLEDHDILLEVWENPDGNSADQLFILVNPDKLNTNQVYDALLADSVSLKPVILPTKQFLITVRGRDSLFFCGTWKPNLRVDSLLKVLKGETSRLLFPKCTINSKSIEVINAKYYFQNNEDPTKHYFAGPFPAYRYAWLVNNVVLFDTAARKTSISLNEISGRLINGLNSVKLRVIGKTDPKFSEDVEIQIEHTPSITPPPPPVSTPLDSFRMEVLVNNILRGRYRSESTVNDDALKIGDEVRLSLQKQNSDGIWSNQSGVDWQEINGRRVTGGSFLDTVQRTDPITKSITANLIGMQNRFLINLVREDTFPPSRVFLPIIDPRVRADSQRIVNVYNRVLSGIQSRNPDLYNFATGGDLSISIYFTDATDSRLGSTNNGVTHHSPIRNNRTYDSLKISNVIDSLHNPILPGMLPPRIVYDAVVVTNLTINTVELDQISGYYLELQKLIAETRTQTPTFAARLELTAQNDQLISIDSLNLFLSPSQIARYQDAVANISIIKPRMSQLLAAIRQNSSTAATYFETQIRNGTAIPTDSLQRVRYTISDGLVPDFVRPDKEVEIYLNWPAFKGDPIGAQSSMAKTLAHELTHARYPFAQPLTSLKWDLIRDQQSSYGYDLSDKKGKNGHCSEGSGHERFNPENRDSCKAQY